MSKRQKSNFTTIIVVAVIVVLTVLLAGCGATVPQEAVSGSEVAGTNQPEPAVEEEVVEEEVVEEEAPSLTPAPESGLLGFGDAWVYEDGLAVTVSAPEPYQRAEYAAGGENNAHHIVFTIRIVNGTNQPYDPTLATVTVRAGTVEGDEIYDMDDKVGGPPYTVVPPNQEVQYRAAFGVDTTSPLLVQVTPDWEYAPALFSTDGP